MVCLCVKNTINSTTNIVSVLLLRGNVEHHEKWYEHSPEGASENTDMKLLWDINIQC